MLRCVGWDPAQTLGVVGDPSASNSRPRAPIRLGEKPRRALVDLVSRFLLWLTRVLYFRDGGYVPYTAVHTYMDTSAHTSIAGGKGAEWISQLMKGDE